MSRKDKGVAPSDSQKKQDDFRRYFAGQSVMKSGKHRWTRRICDMWPLTDKRSLFRLDP